jgi:hypothetical protein
MRLDNTRIRSAAATFRMLRRKVDGSLVNVTDRGRVMQDIVLGLLCGAIMGLFVGYIGKGTPDLVTYELTLDNSCEESGGNRAAMMR